ncbi:MAG TPA: diacylglycerol kinase family protein [Candidatus Limnocylindrales bacterium]|nr:diacylglycerol kinase family protein [Candidatus Limnocylindrales bacterium]
MPEGIKNAILIYNPTSGRRRSHRFEEIEKAGRILKDAGIAVQIAATTAPGTAREMAHLAVGQRQDLVIACGGDGTVNEVINGLAGTQMPMALLPAGTANILAKELGVPWDIPQAARLIPGGIVRRIALGIASPVNHNGGRAPDGTPLGRYFLCVAGAGPDGAIVNGVDEIFKKNAGILAYWAEGMKQLFRYDFPEMRVHSGGQERKATIIVVGRTAHYGGPFKITTGASLFEDSFEMLTNSTRSRLKYLACLPALWMGKLRGVKGIEAWKDTEAICEPAGERMVYAQVDGEPIGPLPLAFRIVPDALSIVVPPGRA